MPELTPQQLDDSLRSLSELTEADENGEPKIKLSPGMQEYLQESLDVILGKRQAGQPILQQDLDFIADFLTFVYFNPDKHAKIENTAQLNEIFSNWNLKRNFLKNNFTPIKVDADIPELQAKALLKLQPYADLTDLPQKYKDQIVEWNGTLFDKSASPYYPNLRKVNHLTWPRIRDPKQIRFPQEVKAVCNIEGFASAKGLKLPLVDRYLHLGITTPEGLEIPQNFNGTLVLEKLKTTKGLIIPDCFIGKEIPKDPKLSPIESGQQELIKEFLDKTTNASNMLKLTIPENEEFEFPENFRGSLDIRITPASTSPKKLKIKLPKTINGNFDLYGKYDLKNIQLPDIIKGDLYIVAERVDQVRLPRVVNGLITVQGIKKPQDIAELKKKFPQFKFENSAFL